MVLPLARSINQRFPSDPVAMPCRLAAVATGKGVIPARFNEWSPAGAGLGPPPAPGPPPAAGPPPAPGAPPAAAAAPPPPAGAGPPPPVAGGPDETNMFTGDALGACDPPVGSVRVTLPDRTLVLGSWSGDTWKPAARSFAAA